MTLKPITDAELDEAEHIARACTQGDEVLSVIPEDDTAQLAHEDVYRIFGGIVTPEFVQRLIAELKAFRAAPHVTIRMAHKMDEKEKLEAQDRERMLREDLCKALEDKQAEHCCLKCGGEGPTICIPGGITPCPDCGWTGGKDCSTLTYASEDPKQ